MQEINKENTNNESDINNIVISRLNKKMLIILREIQSRNERN